MYDAIENIVILVKRNGNRLKQHIKCAYIYATMWISLFWLNIQIYHTFIHIQTFTRTQSFRFTNISAIRKFSRICLWISTTLVLNERNIISAKTKSTMICWPWSCWFHQPANWWFGLISAGAAKIQQQQQHITTQKLI